MPQDSGMSHDAVKRRRRMLTKHTAELDNAAKNPRPPRHCKPSCSRSAGLPVAGACLVGLLAVSYAMSMPQKISSEPQGITPTPPKCPQMPSGSMSGYSPNYLQTCPSGDCNDTLSPPPRDADYGPSSVRRVTPSDYKRAAEFSQIYRCNGKESTTPQMIADAPIIALAAKHNRSPQDSLISSFSPQAVRNVMAPEQHDALHKLVQVAQGTDPNGRSPMVFYEGVCGPIRYQGNCDFDHCHGLTGIPYAEDFAIMLEVQRGAPEFMKAIEPQIAELNTKYRALAKNLETQYRSGLLTEGQATQQMQELRSAGNRETAEISEKHELEVPSLVRRSYQARNDGFWEMTMAGVASGYKPICIAGEKHLAPGPRGVGYADKLRQAGALVCEPK